MEAQTLQWRICHNTRTLGSSFLCQVSELCTKGSGKISEGQEQLYKVHVFHAYILPSIANIVFKTIQQIYFNATSLSHEFSENCLRFKLKLSEVRVYFPQWSEHIC